MAEQDPQRPELEQRLMDPDPDRAAAQAPAGPASLDPTPNATTGALEQADARPGDARSGSGGTPQPNHR